MTRTTVFFAQNRIARHLNGGVRVAVAPTGSDRRGVSRGLLGELLPEGSTLVQVCPACGGAHGAIRVRLSSGAPGRLVSVSYAGGFAAAAVAPEGASAFGIDMELDDAATLVRVREALAARVPVGTEASRDAARPALHRDEAREPAPGDTPDALAPTIADWTRLEAVAKARGTGLRNARGAAGNAPDAHPRGLDVTDAIIDLDATTRAVLSIALA
ncbi:4'-phosphopantetheinyl transferase family protein [Microbacterium halophytorum]|uniref:4'-phosphopantetheinyl transferase family protein n=1 Tax=Microbacterium halophytorum TaxID=2067568 RepID=UPI000CFB0528|nr:4'-phosphopantetheinyl transferase superfamily protein [Microbacterium halophytorum]